MTLKKANSDGFTLVEVLLSVLLAGIVMTGVMQTLISNRKAYETQQEVVFMQQNLRAAKVFLQRDLRNAGVGLQSLGIDEVRVYGLSTSNNAGGDTGTDSITIRYMNYDVGGCGDAGGGVSCSDLPQLTLSASMPASSSEAHITDELGDSPYSKWDGNCVCNGETYGTPPNDRYQAIITSPDGSMSDVVYITNVQNTGGTDKLQNHAYEDHSNKTLNTYPSGSTISFFNGTQLETVQYKVNGEVLEKTTSNEAGASSTVGVAEGIEDLQFAFGLDTDANGVIDDWIIDDDLSDSEMDEVRAVRMNILAKSSHEDPDFTGQREGLEDREAATTTDGFRRRRSTVTIKMRNFGL